MNISDASKIISDGKLKIPLFHATSAHFLESIEKHGLGGINIITDWGIDRVFHRLFQLCDKHLSTSSDWVDEKFIYEKMLEQKVTGGNYNFRHGSVYLTPSWGTVKIYGNNRYGSEYVSSTIKLLEKLEKNGAKFSDNDTQNLLKLLEIQKLPFAPVVLEISDIAVDFIQSETGKNPKNNIEFMEKNIERKIAEWEINRDTYQRACNGNGDAILRLFGDSSIKEQAKMKIEDIISNHIDFMFQQTNFELKQNIPFSQIKVHHLK
jgi:hypothetical protein